MGKMAFLFAGQGSQYVGMAKDIYDMAKDIFDGAEKVRSGILETMWNGPAESLNITENTQVAIFSHDLAVAQILKRRGVVPDVVAGFSLGEIPALCFAGAFDLQTGLEIVDARARAMQKACTENSGVMVVVLRLGADKVKNIAGQFDGVWAVNFNSPEQTVCACLALCADEFVAEIIRQGGRAIKLKVSGAFHSPLMDSASEAFLQNLYDFKFGCCLIPVFSNLTARPYCESDIDMKLMLGKQVNSPVLWQQCIENMLDCGVTTFIEVGSGSVLGGLVKKITEGKNISDLKILSACDMISIDKVVEETI